ncbi:hypothetical protein BC830DRAFT_663289 [Chytriomyces sp. MP71]|nr:hypothetical protein BC830DRAFT_663289 [Chytriomyces sp. MP71]
MSNYLDRLEIIATKQQMIPALDEVMTTFLHSVSTCILYRPLLYLTGIWTLPEATAQPIAFQQVHIALHSTLRVAARVAHLNSWLVSFSNNPTTRPVLQALRRKFWREDWYHAGALFEAALCLWFATCRTQLFWWSPEMSTAGENEFRMTMAQRERLRMQVLDMLRTLQEIEAQFVMSGCNDGDDNRVAWMVACVKGMAREMADVERDVSLVLDWGGQRQIAAEVLDLAALTEGGDSGADGEEGGAIVFERTDATPRIAAWTFQGFLGQYGSFGETPSDSDSWRAFWASLLT